MNGKQRFSHSRCKCRICPGPGSAAGQGCPGPGGAPSRGWSPMCPWGSSPCFQQVPLCPGCPDHGACPGLGVSLHTQSRALVPHRRWEQLLGPFPSLLGPFPFLPGVGAAEGTSSHTWGLETFPLLPEMPEAGPAVSSFSHSCTHRVSFPGFFPEC